MTKTANENIKDINEETAKAESEATETETKEDVKGAEDIKNEPGTEENAETKEDEDLNTKYMRLMADFQNFKKRTEKQKSDIHAYANEKIVMGLIDVVDNFERALAADCEGGEGFKDGMELIFKQLMDVMKNAGVAEIEAENVAFDPNFHNAVMMEDTDKVESGNVSEVLQKGYTLNGKVVRPSMVKVAN